MPMRDGAAEIWLTNISSNSVYVLLGVLPAILRRKTCTMPMRDGAAEIWLTNISSYLVGRLILRLGIT